MEKSRFLVAGFYCNLHFYGRRMETKQNKTKRQLRMQILHWDSMADRCTDLIHRRGKNQSIMDLPRFRLNSKNLWLILLTLRWLACAYKIGTWAATSSIKCLLKMLAISMLSVINHPSSKRCICCCWVPLEGNKGLNFFPEFTGVGTFSRSLNEIGLDLLAGQQGFSAS